MFVSDQFFKLPTDVFKAYESHRTKVWEVIFSIVYRNNLELWYIINQFHINKITFMFDFLIFFNCPWFFTSTAIFKSPSIFEPRIYLDYLSFFLSFAF